MCHYSEDLLYGYDLTVVISCSKLLPVYLFRFQLHLYYTWFIICFAATTIMVNKDYIMSLICMLNVLANSLV